MRFLLHAILPFLCFSCAEASEGYWRGSKPTQLSSAEAETLVRVVGEKAGLGGRGEITDLSAVRGMGIVLGSCGMVKTKAGSLPFWAIYVGEKNPPFWKVGIAKEADKTFGVLSVCSGMNIELPGWKALTNPVNAGPEDGNLGDVTLSVEQRSLLTRDVREKLRYGDDTRLRGLVAKWKPLKKRKIVIVCGYASTKDKNLPFSAVWIEKSSKGPARFAVTSVGGMPIQNLTTFNACKKNGIVLSGSP